MWPEQVGIVKLHARVTATHALNGLAASVWDRASEARIGITLAGQKAAGVVDLSAQALRPNVRGHVLLGCSVHAATYVNLLAFFAIPLGFANVMDVDSTLE